MHVKVEKRLGCRRMIGASTLKRPPTDTSLNMKKSCVLWMLLLAAHASPVVGRKGVYQEKHGIEVDRTRLLVNASMRTCADIQLAQPNVTSGAFVGGFLASIIGVNTPDGGISLVLVNLLIAIVGAAVLIFIGSLISGSGRGKART